MARKRLVTALSILYIMSGLWSIVIFLDRASVSAGAINLDLTRLIGGTLALYVGFHLFRFEELGRKLAILLSSVRVAINMGFIAWSFLQEDALGSALYFLEKQIYHLDQPYAFQIFLFVGVLLAVVTIVFLSQSETKKIFMFERAGDGDVSLESREM